ncbi:hypothetical protein AYO38_05930 [bacterium SCGC AG-212-C10]|nr:hypothetical protein AYO38_05930 [bacterium SCGC AG-212-C10]
MENPTGTRILGLMMILIPVTIIASVFTGGDYLEVDFGREKIAESLATLDQHRTMAVASLGLTLCTNFIGMFATGLLFRAFSSRNRTIAMVGAISMTVGTTLLFVHATLSSGLLTLAADAVAGDAAALTSARALARQLNVLDVAGGSTLLIGVGLFGAVLRFTPVPAGEQDALRIPAWTGWLAMAAPVIGMSGAWIGLSQGPEGWGGLIAILGYNAMMLFFLIGGICLLRTPARSRSAQQRTLASV